MAGRVLRLGILQLAASGSKEEAIEGLHSLSRRIREPDLLVMPEYAMVDPTDMPLEKLWEQAEDLEEPGPWLRAVEKLASEHGSCVVATLFRRSPEPPRVLNTAVVLSPEGRVLGVYDKTHLFDVLGYRESAKIYPGSRLFTPVEACGARLGLAICFEIRYPEIFRAQALQGAELVVVPSAWYAGPMKEESMRFLAQARAHENTVFMTVPILSGKRFTGRSLVVDPMGFVTLDAGPGPTYVEVEADLDRVREVRKILPLLDLRRPQLYREG